MKKIHIINTGETFSKVYNETIGELEIPNPNNSVEQIIKRAFKHNFDIVEITNIIHKDSLSFTDVDRVNNY